MMIYKKTDLKKIDLEERYFQIHNHRKGIPHFTTEIVPFFPIWLQVTGEDQYRVIDGFLITAFAADTRYSGALPAFIFPDGTDLLQLWDFRVCKRYFEDNLSPFCFLETLTKMRENNSIEAIKAILNNTIRQSGYRPLLEISEKLNEEYNNYDYIRSFTDPYSLGIKEIEQLANISKTDLLAISELLKNLRLKGNKLTTILNLITGLKFGYNLEVKKLLADSKIQLIINDLPPHQRYAHLKMRLIELRFPKLHELKQAWNQVNSAINLPERIGITHDPEFESDDIQLTLKAASLQELKSLLKTLQVKVETTDFPDLFNFV